ncbi:MAG: NusG domain II-containing protein [Oscillospiraceae bacterium]
MKKNLFIAAVIAACCALAALVWVLLNSTTADKAAAQIYVDGQLYKTLPLDEDCELVINTQHGSNTVMVSDGSVAVTAADCPDKVCVRTGAVSGGGIPIVCLPHRLEIRVVSAESAVDIVL